MYRDVPAKRRCDGVEGGSDRQGKYQCKYVHVVTMWIRTAYARVQQYTLPK